MTVNEMYNLCRKLIDSGYGDKRMIQYYDCNCAAVGIGEGNMRIDEDVNFSDSGYLFEDGKDESNI